ncbi:serine/threonine protein kinase [Phytoactinopolyspora alkaliphila]|uniref:non-specific serine/threonine protein kinase n=1 Tax=Phytoactinopolyspora alkaliphila TaxID=1783498 RepID=A0A6N9YHD6_9ACTN|nr:serine/threonine-protein kinase [Phytoactinopolyspora alkaliphila]NED94340.1 serine/threonine protein kinase [Phytoactinopolyspora alkaliphila]
MTVLSGRYELGEPLGSGGMARVVSAYDRVLQRDVAVKLIHDAFAFDPSSRERMLREARAAAGLHHPHTVAVFDVGEADGRPFIVMELVKGPTLADRLRTDGRLPRSETLAVADAVLSALHAAHERGLVHRDVKPSNILLPTAGGVKLADFGIAKALTEGSSGLTGTGQLLGTPRYLTPEQVAGHPATPASDLYSLAVVLYECLTGDPPFRADTPIAEALAHQRQPVPRVSDVVTDVPPAVAAAVERAMAKDPQDRYPSAAAMRAALHQRPNEYPPPPPPETMASISAPQNSAVTPAQTTRVLPAAQSSVDAPPDPPSSARATTDRERSRHRLARRLWALGLVAGIAAAIVVVALVVSNGDDPDDLAAPREADGMSAEDNSPDDPGQDDESEESSDENDDDRTARDDDAGDDPGDEAAGWPEHLEGLIAALDADGAAAGQKGEDLAKALREKIQQEGREGKRTEEARKLIMETSSWLMDGEIDTAAGQAAIVALTPHVGPQDDRLTPVRELFVDVAVARRDWGEKGDSLLSELDEVLKAENPRKRTQKAAELRRELAEWIDDDEIDRERGERARQTLRPLSSR